MAVGGYFSHDGDEYYYSKSGRAYCFDTRSDTKTEITGQSEVIAAPNADVVIGYSASREEFSVLANKQATRAFKGKLENTVLTAYAIDSELVVIGVLVEHHGAFEAPFSMEFRAIDFGKGAVDRLFEESSYFGQILNAELISR